MRKNKENAMKTIDKWEIDKKTENVIYTVASIPQQQQRKR